MNYELDEDCRLLADSVARFVARNGAPQSTAAPSEWARLAELGWLGVPHPPELGGFGLGAVGGMIVAEGLGAAAHPAPYVDRVVGCGRALAHCDAAESLTALMEGRRRLAFAFYGAGRGYELTGAGLVAVERAGRFELNGLKANATGIDGADACLVLARLEGRAALFEVPLDLAGVHVARHLFADGRDAARIEFRGVRVPAARLLRADADAMVQDVLAHLLLARAADSIGSMQVLFDLTLAHARARNQFGRPLAAFQELQFRIVDMWIKLDEARSLVATASMALDADRSDARRLARMAWVQATWSGRLIREEAVHIHGAMGMTDECAVGAHVKRLLVNELLHGGPDWHLGGCRQADAA